VSPRPDEAGTPLINVFIDSNVWNFLFERQIDLAVALPSDRFCPYVLREAEFEVASIPPKKAALKAFVETTIEKHGIRTDRFFGFRNLSLPSDEQRVGGFGKRAG
jgi:hypothetical protein